MGWAAALRSLGPTPSPPSPLISRPKAPTAHALSRIRWAAPSPSAPSGPGPDTPCWKLTSTTMFHTLSQKATSGTTSRKRKCAVLRRRRGRFLGNTSLATGVDYFGAPEHPGEAARRRLPFGRRVGPAAPPGGRLEGERGFDCAAAVAAHRDFAFESVLWAGSGGGNGTPLQCSCLENPRDGGPWWAAVYGVAQSRTRLKRLSSSSSSMSRIVSPRTSSEMVWFSGFFLRPASLGFRLDSRVVVDRVGPQEAQTQGSRSWHSGPQTIRFQSRVLWLLQ